MKFIGSLLLLFCLSVELYALKAYPLVSDIYEGESVAVVIHAKGKEVLLPKLNDVAGMKIVDKGGIQRIEKVDGVTIKEFSHYIIFYPTESMMVPSFEVKIDGEKQKTEPFWLEVKKNEQKPFRLEVLTSVEEPVENHVFKLSLRFRSYYKMELRDVKYERPDMAGFWIQGMEYIPAYMDGDYLVQGIDYFLYPQKSGDITIGSAKVEAIQMSPDINIGEFSTTTNYKRDHSRSFTSEPFSIHVKKHKGLDVVGNFTIASFVDKKVMNGNESLSVAIRIKGDGNIGDIKPFELKIQEATVLDVEPSSRMYRNGDKSIWEQIQRFSIGNAKGDFTVPSFELHFQDPQTGEKNSVKTEPIPIKVNNPIVEETIKGGNVEIIKTENKEEKDLSWISLFAGFLLGVLCVVAVQKILKYKSAVKLPKYQSDRELLQKLLTYKGEDSRIDGLISALEANLYKGKRNVIPRGEIKKILKSL